MLTADLEMIREFAEYYRPWKALFWLDFGSAVLSGLLELGFPLAIKLFIDVLLPQGDVLLTILAAVGLAVIMVLATRFHLKRGEPVSMTIGLAVLCMVVAVGRGLG